MARQRNYRKRLQAEREYLKSQVKELTAQVALLSDAKTHAHTSQWEAMARAQQSYTYQAHLENSRLKRALEDQIAVAKALDDLLCKRPKLASFPTMDLVDWKLRQLPADSVGRAAAFHALMDATYADVDSIFLRKRLYDAVDGHRLVALMPTADGQLELESQTVASMNCSYIESGKRYWDLWAVDSAIDFPCKKHEILESFGPSTVYCRDTVFAEGCGNHGKNAYLQRLAAMKMYIEAHRVVIVMKTVLVDALHPVPENLYIGNQTCIYVAEATGPSTSRRRMCLLGEMPVEAPTDNIYANMPPVKLADIILHQLAPLVVALEQMLS
ncbi:hypothetical protein ACHHYP_12030 [Achlya hypogyna]|uniref:START domain-containing protein n=1 Tax=Achlya hypogyna TaxID=1202772 RepID=A0A1V9YHR3_ACHHY|nr:hypothetical protein ACHHYP_12030 [Achlya hypogyna]